MRHELRTADGAIVWTGDTDDWLDVVRLRTILARLYGLARDRAAARERRRARVDAGLCIDCGDARAPKRSRCAVCLILAAKSKSERKSRVC